MENLQEAIENWKENTLKKAVEKRPERKTPFRNLSGTEISILYTPEDIADYQASQAYQAYLTQLGFPGEYPYTRGVQPTMYRGRLWTMRQYAGFATAEESNKRFKYLLEQGQTGLSVAFDLPTQMGYDSDHPLAAGEVGKCGVAVSTLKDMETLFEGIPLDRVSTSMTINSTAMILLAMYIAVGEKQGVSADKLRGTIQNDILKEYVARGTYIFPPRESMRLITDIFEYSSKSVPRWNTISISGYHIREAGSTAVQEVAFTLANAVAYVEAAISKGLEVDEFAPRLAFFFNAHNDFFEEIAKFRAARRIWARLMKERFGAKKSKSMMLRFHTQTAGCSLTAQQPENNVVRVTLQALAAVLGGTQSLHTNSMDEALSLPTEKAVRVALRTQQIIAHESGVANTIDPLAGSYYVEWLTNDMEEKVLEYLDRIDGMGGVLKAIEKGYIQSEIAESAYRYQKNIENKENIVVGVNDFLVDEEKEKRDIDTLKVDPEIEKKRVGSLKAAREKRDNDKVRKCLDELKAAAASDENLMPFVLEAVRAYATIGEICDTLRGVFGVYKAMGRV